MERPSGMFLEAIYNDMDVYGVKLNDYTRKVAYEVCQEFTQSFIHPPSVEYKRVWKKIIVTIIERVGSQHLKPSSK